MFFNVPSRMYIKLIIFLLFPFNRFRVLHSCICLKPERIESVVMACCVLHNLLRIRRPGCGGADTEEPVTHEVIPGSWRNHAPLPSALIPLGGNHGTAGAKLVRGYLKDYYNSPHGSLSWQDDMIWYVCVYYNTGTLFRVLSLLFLSLLILIICTIIILLSTRSLIIV